MYKRQVEELPLEDTEQAVLPMGELAIELDEEVMAEGVIALKVVEVGSPNYRAPFQWRYDYTSLDCVDVTRTSFWHRVYASIWYKRGSGSSWSSMVIQKKLQNNQTLSRCKTGSYKMKVGTKARRTTHYDISFWE